MATIGSVPQTETSILRGCLEDFQRRFNEHPRIYKLCKKWDRDIVVEPTDRPEETYTMRIRDRQVQDVLPGRHEEGEEALVHCRATYDTMTEIFSWRYHPTTGVLDGLFEVFSRERDKIKLEAISFTLWDIPQTS